MNENQGISDYEKAKKESKKRTSDYEEKRDKTVEDNNASILKDFMLNNSMMKSEDKSQEASK